MEESYFNEKDLWVFASSVVFSILDCDLVSHSSCSNIPVLIPSSFDFLSNSAVCAFIKRTLLKYHSFHVKKGTIIVLKYLTQYLHLKVISVSFEFEEQLPPPRAVLFKLFEGTKFFIKNELGAQEKLSSDLLSYKSFAGYDYAIEDIKKKIDMFMTNGIKLVSGILITGPTGAGKTFLGKILLSIYSENCRLVHSENILHSDEGELEYIKRNFELACERSPCILFFDDIDYIATCRARSTKDIGVVNALLHLIDGSQSSECGSAQVLVIGTSSRTEVIDAALRRPGRLCHDIVLKPPSNSDRFQILKSIVERLFPTAIDEETIKAVSSTTSGYMAADLMNLLKETFFVCGNRQPNLADFQSALLAVKPSTDNESVRHNMKEDSIDNFVGFHQLKVDLLSSFRTWFYYREHLRQVGITCPSRFLFFGPSGCGKTLLVRSLAAEFNLPLMAVRRSSVFAKYFGESEQNLAKIFEQARKSSPCVLHFENFDGLAGKKRKDAELTNDVEGRIINHLKVLLDGVIEFGDIVIVAETSRPDLLDKDVIRHGRFHKYCLVPLPNTEDRQAIFLSENDSLDKESKIFISSEISLGNLLERTNGYSCAEVLALKSEILRLVEQEICSFDIAWDKAVSSVLPSCSSKLLKMHEAFSFMYAN